MDALASILVTFLSCTVFALCVGYRQRHPRRPVPLRLYSPTRGWEGGHRAA